MSLEKSLKRILGNIWFLRDNYELFSKNPVLLRRAKQIQNIIELMADYNPKKVTFADRLVLDNYSGSIQHYLTGYDLSSIHLSSKALEVALLFKISQPQGDEKHRSFFDLLTIAVSRGLIKKEEMISAAKKIVSRRNFTVHDAIAEQAILWVSKHWVQQKLSDMPTNQRVIAKIVFKPYLFMLEKRLKLFDSLPDLRWYVSDKSFGAMRNLIVDFLEETIANALHPMTKVESSKGKTVLKRLAEAPKIAKDVKSTIIYDVDFIEYSARQNIKDVEAVLNELYDKKLFRF